MLVTNDGAWANRVLHPRYGVEREYAVLVDPAPSRDDMDALLAGVELDDGPARLLAIQPAPPPPEAVRSEEERGRWFRVRVGEGRKHEVRRLFAAGGLVMTILAVLVARILWAGVLTVRAAVWSANYPRHVMARITLSC